MKEGDNKRGSRREEYRRSVYLFDGRGNGAENHKLLLDGERSISIHIAVRVEAKGSDEGEAPACDQHVLEERTVKRREGRGEKRGDRG